MFAALVIILRKIKLLIKRKINSFKRRFERFFGFKISEFQDSFSLASFFLILYKFIYRIMENESPYYYYNFLILIIFSYYFLFSNFIKKFRKFIKEFIFKPGLSQLFYECGAADVEPQKYFSFFTIKENLFRKFFFFLIFIRLIILCEPFLFIIMNFFLTYFLIFNKYLITASIISIILAISRFTILIEDKTFGKLYHTLNLIDKIPPSYTLIPNYKNTIIVGCWVSRGFMYIAELDDFDDEHLLIVQVENLLRYYELINNKVCFLFKDVYLFEKGIYKKNQIFFYILYMSLGWLCIKIIYL